MSGKVITPPLFVAALAVLGCAPGEGNDPVPTAELFRGTFVESTLLTGELEAVEATSIIAPRTAEWRVQIIEMFPEGETCREGDVILRFDPSTLSQRLDELELSLEEMEDNIANQEAALDRDLRGLELQRNRQKGALDKAQLHADIDPAVRPAAETRRKRLDRDRQATELRRLEEEIRLKKEEGRMDLALLEVQKEKVLGEIEFVGAGIDALTIHAPQDGLIVAGTNWQEDRKFREGDTTWAGMTVLQIPDLSRMRVKARAHELDAMRLRAGQEAQVVLDMYPEETLTGRIEAVANAPANRGRSATLQWFEVQVLLDRTDPGRMRPGMSARLRVFQDKREDALLAPRQAVFEEEDGHVLYVAEGSGRFRAHPVTPAGRNDLFYALADGPPAGSEVALRRPGS